MKLSSFRICGSQAVVALLAMLGSAGTMHAAAQLTMSASTVNFYCSATNPSFPVVVSLTAISAPLTGKTLTVSASSVAPTGFSVVLAGAVIPAAKHTSHGNLYRAGWLYSGKRCRAQSRTSFSP